MVFKEKWPLKTPGLHSVLSTLAGLGPCTQAKEEHTQVCLTLCSLSPTAPVPGSGRSGWRRPLPQCPLALFPISLLWMKTASADLPWRLRRQSSCGPLRSPHPRHPHRTLRPIPLESKGPAAAGRLPTPSVPHSPQSSGAKLWGHGQALSPRNTPLLTCQPVLPPLPSVRAPQGHLPPSHHPLSPPRPSPFRQLCAQKPKQECAGRAEPSSDFSPGSDGKARDLAPAPWHATPHHHPCSAS